VGTRGQARLVARNPLAVVLELGGDPLQVVEVLIPFLLDLREPLLELGLCRRLLRGHYGFFASSSMTS
jgi:hypothetical protein